MSFGQYRAHLLRTASLLAMTAEARAELMLESIRKAGEGRRK